MEIRDWLIQAQSSHDTSDALAGAPLLEQLEPRLLLSNVLLETFESGWDGWSSDHGVWEVSVPTYAYGPSNAHSGVNCAATILDGRYDSDTDSRLISPTVTLPSVSGAEEIHLRFYEWYEYGGGSLGTVDISEWTGSGWSAWSSAAIVAQEGSDARGWSYTGVDLTSYAGKKVRAGFNHQADFFTGGGWYIDDVEIVRAIPSWTGSEGFEDGWNGWYSDHGVWEVGVPTYAYGPPDAHSGVNCAGTILDGRYDSDTDSRLISPTVTLPSVSGAEEVHLRFYEWYEYGSGSLGTIDISEWTGSGWSAWSSAAIVAQSGSDAQSWSNSAVDLTAYAGKKVRVGFYHQADFFTGGGWYIDDVEIVHTAPVWVTSETFESGWNGWSSDHGVWEVGVPTYAYGPSNAHSGVNCAATILDGRYDSDTDSRLISPTVTLPSVSGAEEIHLRFYEWYEYGSGSLGTVDISEWTGSGWSAWSSAAIVAQEGSDARGWSYTGVDLTSYAGKKVRAGFNHQADFFTGGGWYIDDVEIVRAIPSWTGSEGFEDGWGGWYSDHGVWEVGVPTYTQGPSNSHFGVNCAGTILDGRYDSDTDSRLISPTVTLPSVSGAEEVHLRFYEWYEYGSGSLGTIDISEWTGSGWSAWSSAAIVAQEGSDARGWSYTGVDLTSYAGKKVRVGFHHQADFFTGGGWYIDDVEIVRAIPSWTGSEGFEDGWGGWYSDRGVWEAGVPTYAYGPSNVRRGVNCAGTILDGRYDTDTDSRLISPTVILPTISGGDSIELRFFQWYSYGDGSSGTIQVSESTAGSWGPWTNLAAVASGSDTGSSWSQAVSSLDAYAGKTVRIAFYHRADFFTDCGWYIDDPSIVLMRPEIEVRLGGTVILDGQATPVDLGDVLKNTPAPQLRFTIKNAGMRRLTLGPVVLDDNNGFEIQEQPEAAVSPGGASTFAVRMPTASSGEKAATIRIPNNDNDQNPFTFTVVGSVVDMTIPDLVITETENKIVSSWLGEPVSIPVEVRNVGNLAVADTFRVTLYLSDDDVIDENDTAAGSYELGSLGIGSAAGHSQNIRFESPLQEGTYFVAALADSDHAVAEFTETNNWGQQITLRVAHSPDTYVLSVGARFPHGPLGGDVSAQRVQDAFAEFRSVQRADYLGLNANQDDNTHRVVDAVESIQAEVSPGDTFVFYINTHGAWARYGDEASVWAQYDPTDLHRRSRTTGDEYLCLSERAYDWMSDDEFRQLFANPGWQGVNKLFILDTCFSGGNWGTTILGDTGDLATVDRTALIASSAEGDFSWASWDSNSRSYIGILGKALVSALGALKDQAVVTFEELFQRIDLDGSVFRGINGRVQSFVDGNDSVEAICQFDLSGSTSSLFQMTLSNSTDDITGMTAVIGDGAAKSVTYTDADGTVVKVGLKGGKATLRFLGDIEKRVNGKKGIAIEGGNVTLAEIGFTEMTGRGALSFKTKGGDGLATVGEITGGGAFGKLTGKTVDLVGDGIVLTGGGYIGSIQLHDIRNGADIIMPGGGAAKGITLKLNRLYAGTDINLDSGLKSLTATQWIGSSLTAPWASKITTKGDFGADVTLSGRDAPKGIALKSVKIAGQASGTWRITGHGGSIKVGSSSSAWDVDFSGDVKSLASAGDLSGIWESNSLKGVSVKGSIRGGAMSLTRGPDPKLLALGKMTVKGLIEQSRILSNGNIGSVTTGAIFHSSMFVGVSSVADVEGAGGRPDNVLDLPRLEAKNQGWIKSLKVKGNVRDAGGYSMVNCNIAAAQLLKVSAAYAKTANGGVPFGIAADYIKSLSYKGIDGSRERFKDLDDPNDPKQAVREGDLEIRLV